MGKSIRKIVNWKQYNQALVSRGSLTFWVDEAAVKAWHCHEHHGGRGRRFSCSDVAIETALIVKGIFNLSLRALEGFLNSLFTLMSLSLKSSDYTSISKRAKTVNIKYRNPSRGSIRHVVVDATGQKVFGEGE